MQGLLRPDGSVVGTAELMQHGEFRALGKDNETCNVVSAGENFQTRAYRVAQWLPAFRPKADEAKISHSPALHNPSAIGDWAYTLTPVVLRCLSAD